MNRIAIDPHTDARYVGNFQITEDSSLVNELDRRVDVFGHQCEHDDHEPIIVLRETVFDPLNDGQPESYELDLSQEAAVKLRDVLDEQIASGMGQPCHECDHDHVLAIDMGDIEQRLVASLIQSAEADDELDEEDEEELTSPVSPAEALDIRDDIAHAIGRLSVTGVLEVMADLFATGFEGTESETEPNARAANELYDTAARFEVLDSLKSPFADPAAQEFAGSFGNVLLDSVRQHNSFYRPEQPVSPVAQDTKLEEAAKLVGTILGRIARRVR